MGTEQTPPTAPVDTGAIRRCDGCRFWERINASDVHQNDGTSFSDEHDDLVLEGYCKRFPPVIVSDVLAHVRNMPLYRGRFACATPSGMLHSACRWPVTFDCEWCGEWAAK
jgi:hypothetical protein